MCKRVNCDGEVKTRGKKREGMILDRRNQKNAAENEMLKEHET